MPLGHHHSTPRPNNVVTTLSYSADGRLSKAVWSGGSVDASIEWERDAASRVVGETRNLPLAVDFSAETADASYDAAHQRAGAGHDALGRVVSDGARTYQWDMASRLRGFTDASQNTAFRYDGLGQLVGAGASYVWIYGLGLPQIAIERQGQADVRYYLFTPSGQLIESIEAASGERRFYHVDERGTVLFLTGETGAVTDVYAVTPYGEVVRHTGSSSNPFIFLGAHGVMRLGESGLYYARARFYDARHGRFLSKDPLRQVDPHQINPYQYAAGDPVGKIDPAGTRTVNVGAASPGQGSVSSPRGTPAGPAPAPGQPFVDVARIVAAGGVGPISDLLTLPEYEVLTLSQREALADLEGLGGTGMGLIVVPDGGAPPSVLSFGPPPAVVIS